MAKQMCTRCKKQPALPGRKRCEPCRAYGVKMEATRHRGESNVGVCEKCGGRVYGDFSICSKCFAPHYRKEYQAARYRERRDAGLCRNCPEKATQGSYCAAHHERYLGVLYKSQQKRKEKFRATGGCMACGQESDGFYYCEEHRQRQTEAIGRAYQRRREQGLCIHHGCRRKAQDGYVRCRKHHNEMLEYQRERTRSRSSAQA